MFMITTAESSHYTLLSTNPLYTKLNICLKDQYYFIYVEKLASKILFFYKWKTYSYWFIKNDKLNYLRHNLLLTGTIKQMSHSKKNTLLLYLNNKVWTRLPIFITLSLDTNYLQL